MYCFIFLSITLLGPPFLRYFAKDPSSMVTLLNVHVRVQDFVAKSIALTKSFDPLYT